MNELSAHRRGFKRRIKLHGQKMRIYQNNSTGESILVSGIKSTLSKGSRKVMFEFPPDTSLVIGNLIKIEGSSERWIVTSVDEDMIKNTLVKYDVHVEREKA